MRLKLSGVVLAIAGLAQSQNIGPAPSEFEVATIQPSTFEAGPLWFRFIHARRWTAFKVATGFRPFANTNPFSGGTLVEGLAGSGCRVA